MHDAPGEWLDEDEDRTWRAFFETQVLFWRRMARDLQHDTGLSEPDFAILSALLEAPDGALRPYELSEVTDYEKSRLHHHLTRMVGRGLITRSPCPDTPRAAIITLTPEGRAAITAALPQRAAHIRRWLLAPLTPAQRTALTEISHHLQPPLHNP
ncbi:MarR family winged helix-turn-helix transcriptional regulator [Actinocorallia sp. A-T 12471]|uniref:MarR family winged helix-turn-helix transcriptional regulator n=1 Tax=Actinocorallia sp. A-T 12471 TaxID=3089813 RepID=UPI0029D15FE9|nr:MarR family transcriptional regulator [Actinocorallia sp. A-T 12471]MDX6740675.1 MarR family transcriptional regulator [Actinocorallia sp. A-T 12471]